MKYLIFGLVFLFSGLTDTIHSQNNLNQLDSQGKKHGLWKGYYEDTKYLRYEGEFKNGQEIGLFTFYDNTKAKAIIATRDFSKNDGSCYTIFYNGKFKVSEGNVKDKKFEGLWKYYHLKSEVVMTEEHYKSGVLHGSRKVYYNSGALAEEANYVNGKKEGSYKKLAENGVVLEESNFKEGEYHGEALFREANGTDYSTGFYKNGKSVGIWKFYQSGKLVREENKSEKKKAKLKTAAGEAKRKVKANKQ